MKKIVFVVHNLGRERVGGVERVVSELAGALCNSYDLEIVTALARDIPFYEIDPRVRVRSLGMETCDTSGLSPLRKIAWVFRCCARLYSVVRESPRGTTFVPHSPRLGFILSLIFAFIGDGRRLLICEHQAHNSIRSAFYKRLRLWTYRRATLITLNGSDEAFFASHGIRTRRVANFVTEELRPFAQAAFAKRLVYVGRLDEPQKQVSVMFEILRKGRLFDEGYQMTFIGAGPAEQSLRSAVQESKCEAQVHILPFTRDVNAAYGAGSVFLLTSSYEGFPLCLIEAMSQGLPCIAFDCDYGPREIIDHGANGYLIRPGDDSAMLEAIRNSLSEPSKHAQLSANAVKTAELYSLARAAQDWTSVLEES